MISDSSSEAAEVKCPSRTRPSQMNSAPHHILIRNSFVVYLRRIRPLREKPFVYEATQLVSLASMATGGNRAVDTSPSMNYPRPKNKTVAS